MITEAEKLREALTFYHSQAYERPQKIAAAICDSLGVTREMASAIDDGTWDSWRGRGPAIAGARALSALLEVAGR